MKSLILFGLMFYLGCGICYGAADGFDSESAYPAALDTRTDACSGDAGETCFDVTQGDTAQADHFDAIANATLELELKLGEGASEATADTVLRGTGAGTTAYGQIDNGDVDASAAIDATKIHDGSISNTEFGTLDNASGELQSQITAKAPADATYITQALDGDLSAERVITAGEGINLTDGGANSTMTIVGEDATTSNKGIASFNTDHFSISSGAVSFSISLADLETILGEDVIVEGEAIGDTTPAAGTFTAVTVGTPASGGTHTIGEDGADVASKMVVYGGDAGGEDGYVDIYEGGAATEYRSRLIADADLGADRALTLPDESGTLITTAQFVVAGTDPDVDRTMERGRDTNNFAMRGYDGTNQYVEGQKMQPISVAIPKPLDLDEADNLVVWVNRSGFTYNITAIYSYSDTDDTVYTLVELTDMHDFSTSTTIEAITIDTNGTSVFYDELTTGIDHTTVETGHAIAFNNDSADDPDSITFVIEGWFNGDVD